MQKVGGRKSSLRQHFCLYSVQNPRAVDQDGRVREEENEGWREAMPQAADGLSHKQGTQAAAWDPAVNVIPQPGPGVPVPLDNGKGNARRGFAFDDCGAHRPRPDRSGAVLGDQSCGNFHDKSTRRRPRRRPESVGESTAIRPQSTRWENYCSPWWINRCTQIQRQSKRLLLDATQSRA